jgi:hypothetical protein
MTGNSLREQARFWGNINYQDVATESGLTRAYVYMVMCGQRSNPRVLGKVYEKIQQRKNILREELSKS